MTQQTDYFAKTNKRLTAVNWLLENIQKVHKMEWDILFAQAELMEKGQIIDAYRWDKYPCSYEEAEQYYNETYGR